jgi:hypothetical protein
MLQTAINEYLTNEGFNVLHFEDEYTFITGTLNGSDCVDQFLYRFNFDSTPI